MYEQRAINVDIDSQKLVRRFTEELKGTTDLEVATKKAQTKKDDDNATAERTRVQKIVDGINGATSDFSAAEAERRALAEMNLMFAEETKPAKTGFFGLRKSSRTKANELLQDSMIRDFDSLRDLVNGLHENWKASNGPVYTCFQRICKSLDDHKSVFKIFPSQNTYAAVLCGSLVLIVHASVNQDAVPELFSKAVADISEKASLCAGLVDIVREKGLQERLAEVYACMFKFYRDVMKWYLRSPPSKFFRNFSEKLKDMYQNAVDEIHGRMELLYLHERNIVHSKLDGIKKNEGQLDFLTKEVTDGIKRNEGQLSFLTKEVMDMRRELFHERQIGEEGLKLLRAIAQYPRDIHMVYMQMVVERPGNLAERLGQDTTGTAPPIPRQLPRSILHREPVTGKDLRSYSQRLQSMIVGDEGPRYFERGTFWLADGVTVSKLDTWLKNTSASSTLWISSPCTDEDVSGARAAALSAIATAWETRMPVISHFCERPHHKDVAGDLTSEEAGLLGMVYNLIYQLQQFVRDDEEVEVREETLQSLDGSRESWLKSLSMLGTLLQRISWLSHCVIDGLNELEWSGGAHWCQEFLDALGKRQDTQPMNVLITSTGQSRLLGRALRSAEQHMALDKPQEVRLPRGFGPMVLSDIGGDERLLDDALAGQE